MTITVQTDAVATSPAASLSTGPTPITGPIPSVHRSIGPSDLRVFPLAISGNVFGWTADVESTNGILDSFFADGGNFVDTADSYAGRKGTKVLGVLDQLAQELDETPGRIAAAWVISRPGIASAIARCRSAEQVAEFLQAAMLELRPEHIARLDKVSS